jgi:hypothetical protein
VLSVNSKCPPNLTDLVSQAIKLSQVRDCYEFLIYKNIIRLEKIQPKTTLIFMVWIVESQLVVGINTYLWNGFIRRSMAGYLPRPTLQLYHYLGCDDSLLHQKPSFHERSEFAPLFRLGSFSTDCQTLAGI